MQVVDATPNPNNLSQPPRTRTHAHARVHAHAYTGARARVSRRRQHSGGATSPKHQNKPRCGLDNSKKRANKQRTSSKNPEIRQKTPKHQKNREKSRLEQARRQARRLLRCGCGHRRHQPRPRRSPSGACDPRCPHNVPTSAAAAMAHVRRRRESFARHGSPVNAKKPPPVRAGARWGK